MLCCFPAVAARVALEIAVDIRCMSSDRKGPTRPVKTVSSMLCRRLRILDNMVLPADQQ